jgi:hypothetical protein
MAVVLVPPELAAIAVTVALVLAAGLVAAVTAGTALVAGGLVAAAAGVFVPPGSTGSGVDISKGGMTTFVDMANTG